MLTLLERGRERTTALTVTGARWRKSETVPSPFPPTETTQSILDTDPAEGGGSDAIFRPLSAEVNLFLRGGGKDLCSDPSGRDQLLVPIVPHKDSQKGEAAVDGGL